MRKWFYTGLAVSMLLVPAIAFAGSTAKVRFSLTLGVVGPGTVSASPGARCAGYLTKVHSCRFVYAAGSKVKLTATPKVDVKLSSWSGSVKGKALTQTLTMNGPKVVTATFVKVPAPPAPPPPPPVGSTKANPLPLGQSVGIVIGAEHWRLHIISTQPDATAAVLAENQFNDPPVPGNQFFIATVGVDYVSGAQAWNPGIRIVDDLMTVGPSNVVYSAYGSTSRCGVIPDDFLFKPDLLPGGSMTGNQCWSVPSSEAGSLVAFIELDNTPFWMALR